MKLYYTPGAGSLCCHIVAQELGLPLKIVKVNLREKKSEEGDFLAVNPKGQIPALVLENGEVLTEGVAILQYLAAQKATEGLMPAAPGLAHYRALEWLNFTATELHKNYTPLFFPDRFVADEAARAQFVEGQRSALLKKLSWVDGELKGRAFVLGDRFTICDAYLFTCLSWSRFVNLDTSSFEHLTAWMGRVGARPAVLATLKAEGLLK